jgi:hypothetical protein
MFKMTTNRMVLLLCGAILAITVPAQAVKYKVGFEVKDRKNPNELTVTIAMGKQSLSDKDWVSLSCQLKQDFVAKRQLHRLTVIIFGKLKSAKGYVGQVDDVPGAYKAVADMRARYNYGTEENLILLNHTGREGELVTEGRRIPLNKESRVEMK